MTDLKFDWISKFVNGYAIVRIDNEYDLVDLRGQTILLDSKTYSNSFIKRVDSYKKFNRKFDRDLVLLYTDHNNKARLIKDSKVVDNYLFNKFDYIDYFNEENFSGEYRVAKVIMNGKYGLINREFKVVLHPEYDRIGFITHPHYHVTHPHYQKKSFHIALVTIEGKSGLINKHGHFIVQPVYQNYGCKVYDCFEYSDKAGTLYEIGIGGKWGLINSDGGIIAEPKYDFIGKFCDGVAVVHVSNKYGIIDQNGREIISPYNYSNDRHYSYIDDFNNGQTKAKFRSETTSTISVILGVIIDRNFPVRENNKWVFYFEETIDLTGNLVKK